MTNKQINHTEIRNLAKGQWLNIIASIDPRFSEAVDKFPNHVPCPIGTGSEDGFRFGKTSQEDGHAFSNTGEKLGSGFDVLMWANDWDFRQALEAVHHQLGKPLTTPNHTPIPPPTTNKPQKTNTIPEKIWNESVTVTTSHAKQYLDNRGLNKLQPQLPPSLRCHDSLEYREGKEVLGNYPAIIGQITKGENNSFVGIQRHYLSTDGKKADVKNPKMMLSKQKSLCSGGAVRLGNPKQALAVTEGIENGLAVQLSTDIPTWAATTGTLLANMEVPELVKIIYIFADKDKSEAGKRYANQLAERLRKIGKTVHIFMPPITRPQESKGVDWLDVLNSLGKEPFIQAIEATKRPNKTSQEKKLKLTETLHVFPETNENGKPLNVYQNFTYMLDKYGIECRYNVIKKDIEAHIPNTSYSKDNGKTSVRAHILSTCQRNKYPVSLVDDYLNLAAEENHTNPVIEWINSKEWDGTERWEDFVFQTIKTEKDKEDMAWNLISKWMLSAVAMAENGLKGEDKVHEAHGILIFTGAQGMGKTSWFKRLVGDNSELALDGFLLDPNNKDSVRTAISHWLVELGEIDSTFRKSDLSALKAFTTRPTDKLRKPYGRDDCIYPRRTVFFGSVNDRQFLMDTTGNRRYWVIEPTGIDYQHNFDMQQVWAEVYFHYKGGMKWWLNPKEEEQLNLNNNDFEVIEPLEELLLRQFDFYGNELQTFNLMTATEILIALGYDQPKKGDAMKVARIVEKITGSKAKKSNGKKVFHMPPQFTMIDR